MYYLLALACFLSHTICSCHLWDRIKVYSHFICVECGDLDTTSSDLPYCKSIFASKLLFTRFWRFSIELSRVLWIGFSEKGRLQWIVTVVKRKNVKNRNRRQQRLQKTWAPRSVTKKKTRIQEGRTFRQEWKKTLANWSVWLQFDETKQEMFCTACWEFPSLTNKNSSYSTGSPSFHTGDIIVNIFKVTTQFQLLSNLL